MFIGMNIAETTIVADHLSFDNVNPIGLSEKNKLFSPLLSPCAN